MHNCRPADAFLRRQVQGSQVSLDAPASTPAPALGPMT